MIHAVAYLKMCPNCMEHGCFVLSDGSSSREFSSKEAARKELKRLLKRNLIQQDEFRFLDGEIDKNRNLAPTARFVDFETKFVCSGINMEASLRKKKKRVEETTNPHKYTM